MEKVNGIPLFYLGISMGGLMSGITTPSATIGMLATPAKSVLGMLEYFINVVAILPLTKGAARELSAHLQALLTSDRLAHPDGVLADHEKTTLSMNIMKFQNILAQELPEANIYSILPKRAYDMTVLINKGENVLPQNTLKYLESLDIGIILDIREATKCLAFDIPTAVGFYVYRAIEAIVVKGYFPILAIDPGSSKNLGRYIELLESKKVDPKITALLTHLKDHYRNPIAHPAEQWTTDQAESAFQFAVSAMTVIIQDIQELSGKAKP